MDYQDVSFISFKQYYKSINNQTSIAHCAGEYPTLVLITVRSGSTRLTLRTHAHARLKHIIIISEHQPKLATCSYLIDLISRAEFISTYPTQHTRYSAHTQ